MAEDLPDRHIFKSPKFRSVVNEAIDFFENTLAIDLPPTVPFAGAGVYALYYLGKSEFYEPLSLKNKKASIYPIYVGKAVPGGWRQGRYADKTNSDLFRRLNEHSRSISQTKNLRKEDFRCRYMILGGIESDLIVPVEATLIRKYRPVWNSVVDGFGNHDPGSGRYNQAISEWDVLHPGRAWATRLKGQSPILKDVLSNLKSYFSSS